MNRKIFYMIRIIVLLVGLCPAWLDQPLPSLADCDGAEGTGEGVHGRESAGI